MWHPLEYFYLECFISKVLGLGCYNHHLCDLSFEGFLRDKVHTGCSFDYSDYVGVFTFALILTSCACTGFFVDFEGDLPLGISSIYFLIPLTYSDNRSILISPLMVSFSWM